MLNVIICGAPGCGKGTQAERIEARYGINHVSTGAVIRGEIARGTELGRSMESYITAGKLAPDEMMKQYKGQMSVSAELYFSPEQLKQRHVQQGKIKFYDAQGLYGTVVIDVINSRVKRD